MDIRSLITFIVIFIRETTGSQELTEYCEDESFIAKCADNEAIIINSAEYGRMRTGRCVSENVRLGCQMDVLTQLDRWCSGRPNCAVQVTSLLHEGKKPCPKDYRSYLEAKYSCIPVVQATKDECFGQRPVKITSKNGYISSLVTKDSGCGSIDNPWLLEADPGQRINISLYDFSMYNSSPSPTDPNVCMVYAIIREPSGDRRETVCGGKSRMGHVFTSVTSTVEVRLRGRRNNDSNAQFILKFQSVGCPDPETPAGGWAKRQKDDTVVIGCNLTDEEWTLKCSGTEWLGEVGSCPHGDSDPNNPRSLTSSTIPSGMSIVLVVGIALIVGLCILLVGLLCLRRQRLRADQHHYDSAGKPRPTNVSYDMTKPPGQAEYYAHNGENDYYRTWQLQQRRGGPVPPTPGENVDYPLTPASQTYRALSTDSSFSAQNGRYSEHLYESPKFDRRDIGFPDDSGTEKYFELDPEAPLPAGNAPMSRDHPGTKSSSPKTDCSLAKR